MKPGVLWVAEWVRSGAEAKGWALADVCRSAGRVSEAGAWVCRSRTAEGCQCTDLRF